MAGRKKSSKRSSKKGRKPARRRARQSYTGLTRKQLIARLRAATKGKATSKRRKGRKKGKRASKAYEVYGPTRKTWDESKSYVAPAEDDKYADWGSSNDPGRRRKKGKKTSKGRKRPLSAWQRFIKTNKNRRGMRKKNGMLNLRALAAAYHKTPAGRKKAKPATKRRPKRASASKRRAPKRAKKRSSRRDYGWT